MRPVLGAAGCCLHPCVSTTTTTTTTTTTSTASTATNYNVHKPCHAPSTNNAVRRRLHSALPDLAFIVHTHTRTYLRRSPWPCRVFDVCVHVYSVNSTATRSMTVRRGGIINHHRSFVRAGSSSALCKHRRWTAEYAEARRTSHVSRCSFYLSSAAAVRDVNKLIKHPLRRLRACVHVRVPPKSRRDGHVCVCMPEYKSRHLYPGRKRSLCFWEINKYCRV